MRGFLLVMLAARAFAANTFSVTKLSDDNDTTCATGGCSLRAAVANAAAGDTITLDAVGTPAIYALTIGQVQINQGITITGKGAAATQVSGATNVIFQNSGGDSTISGLTVSGGTNSAVEIDGGSLALSMVDVRDSAGIGILDQSVLTFDGGTIAGNMVTGITVALDANTATLSNCKIQNNKFHGMQNSGTVSLTSCEISGNGTAGANNGIGIYSFKSVTLTECTVHDNLQHGVTGLGTMNVVDSTIRDNQGTGITHNPSSSAMVTIRGTTVSGNLDGGVRALAGGAFTLTNSTVSGNSSAVQGGGVQLSDGTITLNNVTITKNATNMMGNGGVFGGGVSATTGTLTMSNTIVADNRDGGSAVNAAPDCGGNVQSLGYNLIANSKGCNLAGTTTGNLLDKAAMLGPLADNGGPTQTHALLGKSPALGAGSNGTPACEMYDQRGEPPVAGGRPRSSSSRCDIGAFQNDGIDLQITQSSPGFIAQGQTITLLVTVTNLSTNPASAISVSDTPSGLSFVSAAPVSGSWTCSGSTCTLPSLAAGASASFNVMLSADMSGSNSATVTAAETELDPSDNTTAQTLPVTPLDFDDGGFGSDLANPPSGKNRSGGCSCQVSAAAGAPLPMLALALLGARLLRRRKIKR